MNLSISQDSLSKYLCLQVNHYFPDDQSITEADLTPLIGSAIPRLELIFSKINIKYFFDGKTAFFNHLNGDQYSMFLYLVSHGAFSSMGNAPLASKIYLLNKALHGIDAFYEVDLPEIFLFVHPLGTVLGRARYSDYLVVYQRCGIGTNQGSQPTLGRFLTLHPGAAVLGGSVIGDNCAIATESLVLDTNIAGNQNYIGNPKNYDLYQRDDVNEIWIV